MSAAARTHGYAPQQGSIAWKVIEFLTTHPDESLSSSDIGAKFDVATKQVHSLLAKAVASGALTRAEDADDELVYSLGTGSPAVSARPAAHPTLHAFGAAPAPSTTAIRRPPPVRVDLAEIAIEPGVPFPSRGNNGRLANDWPSLFQRMRSGDSVLLPKGAKSAVLKAISDFQKKNEGAALGTRLVDEESFRVWRLK